MTDEERESLKRQALQGDTSALDRLLEDGQGDGEPSSSVTVGGEPGSSVTVGGDPLLAAARRLANDPGALLGGVLGFAAAHYLVQRYGGTPVKAGESAVRQVLGQAPRRRANSRRRNRAG